MCMQKSAVRSYQQWRWAGDEIVPQPVIPAARRVAGSRKRAYPIDIREYLSIDSNVVVRNWLQEFLDTLAGEEQVRFHRHDPGSFDFRAETVLRSMRQLHYRRSQRSFDQWLFPDETLALGSGDCEDLAFVLAALLGASGISQDCFRVALGTIIDHGAAQRAWDHVWVVYQMENGAWQILEPLAKVHLPAAARPCAMSEHALQDIEYIPHFVFNAHHLWRVRSPENRAADTFDDYLVSRPDNFWADFDPSFAAGVHFDIFDEALAGMSATDLNAVKAASLWADVNVLRYDPRDHFDFGYIPESWALARARLATGKLRDFGLATHAIADFYAHSLYGYFAKPGADGKLPLCDPDHGLPADILNYDFLKDEPRPGSSCDGARFTQLWQGKLISGQWWRWYSTYPQDLRGELPVHRCLPDHDRLAVDSPQLDSEQGNALFPTADVYRAQFALRRQAAIEHVHAVYAGWRKRA